MHVQLEIPELLAERLGRNSADLARAALEGLALEGIRSEKLSVAQARQLLGIPTRYEMDGFLKEHGVLLDLTAADVLAEADAARRFVK